MSETAIYVDVSNSFDAINNRFLTTFSPKHSFLFQPEEDITILELALCLSLMLGLITTESADAKQEIDNLPQAAKRHFKHV